MKLHEMTLPQITLGWELEARHSAGIHVPGVECGHDGSVGGQGLEYRIKREHVYNVEKSLRCLRTLATDPLLEVDSSCGFHVHLGLARRTRRLHDWAQWFVQLAREVESSAFKAVPSSRVDNHYCRSWRVEPGAIGNLSYHPSKHSNRDRYQWVNPVEVFRPGGIRTVEIRLLGNTKRYTYLLAWISICRLMAQSSWALIFDASRLEEQKRNIQEAFKLCRETFLVEGVPKKQVVKNALYLATKAGLTQPFGKPLAELSEIEQRLSYKMERATFAPNEWTTAVNGMRIEYDRVRTLADQRAQSGQTSGIELFTVGDVVQALAEDEDCGIMPGEHYRVSSVNGGSSRQPLGLLIRPDRVWWVHPRCVRRVEDTTGVVCVA